MRCRVPVPAGGSSFVNCTAVVAESDDSGASFRDFRDVTPEQESSGGFGGIETAAGRLIFSSPGSSKTGVLYSDDAGASWAWGAPAAGAAGENEVAEIRGGALLMTVRRSNNTRLLLSSPDGGLSWSAPSLMAVTDPNCEASMIAVHPAAGRGGDFLLFANPHTSGLLPYAEGRQNVTVQISRDAGASWRPILLVDEGPRPTRRWRSCAPRAPARAHAACSSRRARTCRSTSAAFAFWPSTAPRAPSGRRPGADCRITHRQAARQIPPKITGS